MIKLKHHHDGLGLTELCLVLVADQPHPVNGAHHEYWLKRKITKEDAVALNLRDDEREAVGDRRLGAIPWEEGQRLNAGKVQFQRGPRNASDSTPGTLDGALLAILIHRYECFQAGPFECPENAEVLRMLSEALDYIKARAHERAARGVLGRNEK